MTEISEIKKMVLSLSDREIITLLGLQKNKKEVKNTLDKRDSRSWMDKPICGLDKEGIAHFKELKAQLDDVYTAHNVDRKQVRYLKALSKMKLEVPPFFRETVDPRKLYNSMKSFCINHDIPDEIIPKIIPALVAYIETGHMRPIIFVGEKGCGKTTAVKLLVKGILQIPTEIIKIPQTDGGHGMSGDSGKYQSADLGYIAKARLRAKSIIVGYIFDEVDKVTHDYNHASVDDELLSITDESNNTIYDNYLEARLVGLEYCPMFFTANDLQKVNPMLADRCMVIPFPNANVSRIKSISKKYAERKLESSIYSMIKFDYNLMFKSIEHLVAHNVTSLRRHQQMIEIVLEDALDTAFTKNDDTPAAVTEDMFNKAEEAILGSEKREVGFKV